MNLHNRKQMPEGEGGGGGGGGVTPPWFGEFKSDAAPEFKQWVTTKNFADPQAALYSAFNQEKLIGPDKVGRTVLLPKDDNDAEGIKAFRTRMGVPEKPEGYELPLYEGATEPDEFQKALAGELHRTGVTKTQAQALAKWVNEFDKTKLTATNTAAEQKSQADLTTLKTEWGTAHDANHGLAVTLMGHMGFSQDEIKAMSKSADILKKFHKGAAALGAKPMVQGEGGGGVTREQAREKLEEARTKRSKGEISDEQWYEAMNRLSPIANAA